MVQKCQFIYSSLYIMVYKLRVEEEKRDLGVSIEGESGRLLHILLESSAESSMIYSFYNRKD